MSFKFPTILQSGNLFFRDKTVCQGGIEFAKFRKTYFLHFEELKSEAADHIPEEQISQSLYVLGVRPGQLIRVSEYSGPSES